MIFKNLFPRSHNQEFDMNSRYFESPSQFRPPIPPVNRAAYVPKVPQQTVPRPNAFIPSS